MIFLIPAENVCFHNFPAVFSRSGGVVTGECLVSPLPPLADVHVALYSESFLIRRGSSGTFLSNQPKDFSEISGTFET